MDIAIRNYGLSKSKEEGDAQDQFVSPLPRAVLRPNTFVLLDGEWRFCIDLEGKGLEEKWFLGHEYKYKALWPGSIEKHMADAKGEQLEKAWQDKVVAWYEREFPLPERNGQFPTSILQLTFGACGYETRVWLNGIPLRTIEGDEAHLGEYTSFSYELTDDLLKPVNRLTVRIADTMDADIPRGKQESHVYKRGGIWYQTYTGAVRSVWLEFVDRNRLRSRVGVISIVEDKMVRFNFTTRIHDPDNYRIRVKVYHRNDANGEPIATDEFPLHLEVGQKRQRLVIELSEAALWSPESPHLYRLAAQLIDDNDHASEIETDFGLRKIEARGCCVYLNNEPLYLDGILYQPGIANFEEIEQHMYAMKELGCNLVRIHIAGVDPRIYKLADRIGMLLWVEVPSPHRSSYRSQANHSAELMRMLALIETHPSVVIWSLFNEDWGIQDIATNPETQQYVIDTYYYMQLHHSQFLVVENDGWHHISLEGRLKSDLLTAHFYTSEIQRWREILDRVFAGDLQTVAAFPLIVGDPFFYRKQVPFVVSEWGGFGFVEYGGPKDTDERAALIKQFKEELRKRPVAGDVYTQATNIEDERNGLIDAATGELKVPAGLLSSRKTNEAKTGEKPVEQI